jgi:hypothetical protein
MAYTAIDNPELYFQVKLYTGNGSDDHAQTFDGDEDMQPDLNWIKERSSTSGHRLFDSVRGSTKYLESSDTSAEGTSDANSATFDSDGFTVDSGAAVNENTVTYVAWCWKESATAGFDIVSYTGTGSAKTEAHSLSAVPHVMIVRNRPSNDGSWQVYHQKNTAAPETDVLQLQLTNPTEDSAVIWNDTAPTSSVFSVGTHLTVNEDGSAMIAWLFSEKQGFSKFGSYTGRGPSNFPFIYLGFRPAFVLIKGAISGDGDAAQNWELYDNKRAGYNGGNATLYPNATYAEGTNDRIHLMSNGFKININSDGVNDNNSTYIYMAFAEAPFVNSNGVPCNAR